MTRQPLRRIVVWTDGSAESAGAAGWAARHATARALPLHVLHFPRVSVPVAMAAAGSAAADGSAVTDHSALDVVETAEDVRRIQARHHGLSVSVEVVQDGRRWPDRTLLGTGDVLVTGLNGFIELAVHATADETSAHAHLPAPVVVVPETEAPAPRERRVLLLTGPRLSSATAAFAFSVAADLGAALDSVRIAPQDGAFGEDYWTAIARSSYLTETRLQAELARLRARFPGVPGSSSTLRTRPWTTLRTMARTAHLAVLGGGPEMATDLRVLLDLGACPIAVVPEP